MEIPLNDVAPSSQLPTKTSFSGKVYRIVWNSLRYSSCTIATWSE